MQLSLIFCFEFELAGPTDNTEFVSAGHGHVVARRAKGTGTDRTGDFASIMIAGNCNSCLSRFWCLFPIRFFELCPVPIRACHLSEFFD